MFKYCGAVTHLRYRPQFLTRAPLYPWALHMPTHMPRGAPHGHPRGPIRMASCHTSAPPAPRAGQLWLCHVASMPRRIHAVVPRTTSAAVWACDGELSKDMNTRVQSEPRYDLRKRNPSQVQQNTLLLLPHEFEKLTIH